MRLCVSMVLSMVCLTIFVSCEVAGQNASVAHPVVYRDSMKQGITSHRQEAPLKLALTGHQAGEFLLLDLVIEMNRALSVQPEIRFILPEGAEMVEGSMIEIVTGIVAPGSYARQYKIANVRGPVVATADILTPGFGLHAEAEWPPKVLPKIELPKEVSIPPTVIYGMPVDSAISLN